MERSVCGGGSSWSSVKLIRSDNVPEEQAGNGLSGGKDDANLPRNLF